MKPYVETDIFSLEELMAFQVAQICVGHIPQTPDIHNKMRCHELARIVAPFVGGFVVDGKYGMAEHSWIGCEDWDPHHIIDVYAVGRMPMTQLVDALPSPHLYKVLSLQTLNLRTPINQNFILEMQKALSLWTGRMELALRHVTTNEKIQKWLEKNEKRRGYPAYKIGHM